LATDFLAFKASGVGAGISFVIEKMAIYVDSCFGSSFGLGSNFEIFWN